MAKMMKRNPYRTINGKAVACVQTVNRWLIGTIAAICKDCGVSFKIDDSSVNERDDTVDAVFAAETEEQYLSAAIDLHNVCGFDLA